MERSEELNGTNQKIKSINRDTFSHLLTFAKIFVDKQRYLLKSPSYFPFQKKKNFQLFICLFFIKENFNTNCTLNSFLLIHTIWHVQISKLIAKILTLKDELKSIKVKRLFFCFNHRKSNHRKPKVTRGNKNVLYSN